MAMRLGYNPGQTKIFSFAILIHSEVQMRRPLILVAALLVAGLLVAGCGSSGHSADPPVSVVALAGDQIVEAL